MTTLETLQALSDEELIENAECGNCGTRFHQAPSRLANGMGKYCSRDCFYDANRKHPYVDFGGIRYRFSPATGYYENSNVGKKLHREVWKKEHGTIPDGFDVHHIDENKANNDPSNLEIMEHGEHTRHHHRTGRKMMTCQCSFCHQPLLRIASTMKRTKRPFCSRRCHMLYRNRVLVTNPSKYAA